MDNQQKEKEIKYTQTPTSMTDTIKIGVRTNESILLQFLSDTPDFLFENHRTIIHREIAIQLVNLLCNATNHYPKEPKPKKKK